MKIENNVPVSILLSLFFPKCQQAVCLASENMETVTGYSG